MRRRAVWAQLIRRGVPSLFVLRPSAFTPADFGAEYPAPDPEDKFALMRTRQMYQQKRIGTAEEVKMAKAKAVQFLSSLRRSEHVNTSI